MSKFLIILVILFIGILVIQQSHSIEKKTMMREWGPREEYVINWGNLTSYILDIPNKIKITFNDIKCRIKERSRRKKR